ncbi:cyclic GMP-AMP synthase-like [Protopterus annectens]|uniref:cyclic GMP-AMP synthase-like n=1 Tax=Protopterus annectens TaxID=7888 RepID=UPI001CF9CA8F|nr:cyclic GMP-AMP synthase-like [Protopterus annectens]
MMPMEEYIVYFLILTVDIFIFYILMCLFNRYAYKLAAVQERAGQSHSLPGKQHINFNGAHKIGQRQCSQPQKRLIGFSNGQKGRHCQYCSQQKQLINPQGAHKKTKSAYHTLANKITFSKYEMKQYTMIAENTVRKLITQMKKEILSGDLIIDSDFIRAGSSFEGLKVKPDIEFDFLIPLSPPELYRFHFSSKTHGIPAMFCLVPILELQARSIYQKPVDFKKKFCSDWHLQSLAVRRWFQSLADRAVRSLPEISLEVRFSEKGPARTMKIRKSGIPEISVDLVPAIYVCGIYLVAKTYGGITECQHPLKDKLWRMSFSVQEKKILENISSHLPINACHQKTLQIVKHLKQSTPPLQWSANLSSYHLKTVWLHMLQKKSLYDWQHEKLDQRVLELIDNLVRNLRSKILPHFFIGNKHLLLRGKDVPKHVLQYENECNLFSDMHPSTLKQVCMQLEHLKYNLDNTVGKLCASI